MDRRICMCKMASFPEFFNVLCRMSSGWLKFCSCNSIVGKGIHSASHIQKLKPRVEQICREMGLQYTTEENSGRIYVNLTGGPAVPPPEHHDGYSPPHHQQQQQGGYSQHPPQQQQPQQDDVEQLVDTLLPRLITKLQKACCLVMWGICLWMRCRETILCWLIFLV